MLKFFRKLIEKKVSHFLVRARVQLTAKSFEKPTFTTEWYENEKASFSTQHDKNGDGYLDLEEIIIWQHPEQYDGAAVEAKWLLENVDLGELVAYSRLKLLRAFDQLN